MRRTSAIAALVATSALVLTACGSDDGGDDDTASVTTELGITVNGADGEKPDLEIPEGDPSGELGVEVLSEGDGPELTGTDYVVANYLGQTWAPRDDEEYVFDNSYDTGQSAVFGLDKVVPGWTEGLSGQKVGSRVLLSIPPEQGYGVSEEGQEPASDLVDETLVFVVEIVDAIPADAGVSGEPVADLPADLPAIAGDDPAVDPTVTFPATATAPAESSSTVLVAGDGADLSGMLVVHALQVSYATGQVQFSTRAAMEGAPAQGAFAMSPDQLPGLAETLEGQKVGSRVLIRVAAAENVTEAAPEGEALALVVDIIGTFEAGEPPTPAPEETP